MARELSLQCESTAHERDNTSQDRVAGDAGRRCARADARASSLGRCAATGLARGRRWRRYGRAATASRLRGRRGRTARSRSRSRDTRRRRRGGELFEAGRDRDGHEEGLPRDVRHRGGFHTGVVGFRPEDARRAYGGLLVDLAPFAHGTT